MKEQLIEYIKYCMKIESDVVLTEEEAELIIKALEQEQKTCDGCLYDNMGVIPPYICLQCSRFYSDKYTAESGENQ